MKKILAVVALILIVSISLSGCKNLNLTNGTKQDNQTTAQVAGSLSERQPTPTDIEYSLERFNLIRRAYWVNGQREKSREVVCSVNRPLGYIVLFAGNTLINRFTVDGKVSSLNSYLTANNVEKYYNGTTINTEMPDIDGSYGENDGGIFFFTVDGSYVEWTGDYIYSDMYMEVENPAVVVREIE